MYYILNYTLLPATQEDFYQKVNTICVLSYAEWEQSADLKKRFNLHEEKHGVHICKLEEHNNYLYATYKIPPKIDGVDEDTFAFYILPGRLIFIDSSNAVNRQLSLLEKHRRSDYNLQRFLFYFLISFLENDLFYLQLAEQKISAVEEQVLKGECKDFGQKMLEIKKSITKFIRYYNQLVYFGQKLSENINLFNNSDGTLQPEEQIILAYSLKDDLRMFNSFTDKALHLANEAQALREYAMQVQEVYQSETAIKQNEVMRTLTVVTAVFMPLSLIAGWYGMNFSNMPELSWSFGYLGVVALSALVVVLCLYIFKKKKFW